MCAEAMPIRIFAVRAIIGRSEAGFAGSDVIHDVHRLPYWMSNSRLFVS